MNQSFRPNRHRLTYVSRFLHGFPTELTTGGVDIPSQLPPDRNVDTLLLQSSLECGDPAAGFQRALLDLIEGDEIHMARRPLQMRGEQIGLPVAVIHPVDLDAFASQLTVVLNNTIPDEVDADGNVLSYKKLVGETVESETDVYKRQV